MHPDYRTQYPYRMDDARSRLACKLRRQARSCASLGSPLYELILERAAEDVETGGSIWRVLEGREDDPKGSARALRFVGAVHRLVLSGAAPALDPFYPSVGGDGRRPGIWDAFLAVVEDNVDLLRELALRPVQTNEVGRAGALVGGFLEVARTTGRPLRTLELGTSAGLNLRWDHFFYEARGKTWGDPTSPVRLCDYNSERPLPFDVEVEVVERAGCDEHPLDPATSDGYLTLASYVWPDQVHRHRLLKAAVEVAKRVPARVDAAGAGDWLERELKGRPEGSATVVFHSIVMQYVDPDERERIEDLFEEYGAAAADESPLARLKMEPAGEIANVSLEIWPPGGEWLVATTGYHGAAIRWLGLS